MPMYGQPMYEQPLYEMEPMPMHFEQPRYEMMPMPVPTSPVPLQYIEPMPLPPAPAEKPPPPVHKKKQGNSCRCGSPAHLHAAAAGKRGPLTGPRACAVCCGLFLLQVRLPRRVGRYHVCLRGVDHGAALLRCQASGSGHQEGVPGTREVCALSLP